MHYFDPAPSVARHALSLLQERELFRTEGDRTWFSTRASNDPPMPCAELDDVVPIDFSMFG